MSGVRRWWPRLGFALGAWLLAWGYAALRGSSTQPVLLALAVVTAVALGGVVVDAGAAVSGADWVPSHRAKPRQWGLDPRFSRLARSLSEGTDPQLVAEQVHESISTAVDGLLVSRHGIDRHRDPAAARAVLGDAVTGYLERPPRYRRGYFAELPALLADLESL